MVGIVGELPSEYAILSARYLADLACSKWLQEAITSLEVRDPVDAVNDVEILLQLANLKLAEITQKARHEQ